MSDIRPRRIAHRGHVRAMGFTIRFNLVPSREARRRILDAWQPNSLVYRLEGSAGLLFLLPKPTLVCVDQAIGLPLVSNEGVLSGAPLSTTELAGIARSSFVEVKGGELVSRLLTDLPVEMIENWIQLDGFRFESGVSLGEAPTKPRPIAEPQLKDVRDTLKSIPDQAAEARGFLARLKGARAGTIGERSRMSWSHLLGFIRSFVPSKTPQGQTTVTRSRFALWINAVANRMMMITRLSRVLGWRQARYLGQVFEMFESGNVDEALRHAIPLASVAESPLLNQSFGVPTPRQNLQINSSRNSVSSAMGFGQSIYSELEQLYRRTFKRLEAQGRIEEAAFVLAELLRAEEEAVAFLERHGKLRQAAELAEGRQLRPELVVRQWYLAGEKERAVWIARKSGAFLAAITSLEVSRSPFAALLRKDWAQTLADAGDPAAAVDVLWPSFSDAAETIAWMKKALEIGGVGGARNLARLLTVSVGDLDNYFGQALALLQGDSLEEAPLRAEFSATLARLRHSSHTQTIARAAVRSALRDAGGGLQPLTNTTFRHLLEHANDGVLRADIPRPEFKTAILLRSLKSPVTHSVGVLDRNVVNIHDVAPLQTGGFLVAHGEAGLRILSKEGRSIAHISEPAYSIVPSGNGSRAIVVAPRGKQKMVSKLDVPTRKATPWCLTEFHASARSFDGGTWYIASEGDVYAIDATSEHFDALWRIPDIGEPASPLTITSDHLCMVSIQHQQYWLWEFRLPNMRLTSKTSLEFEPDAAPSHFVACGGGGVVVISNERQNVSFSCGGRHQLFMSVGQNERVSVPMVTDKWLAMVVQRAGGASIAVYRFEKKTVPVLCLEVRLEGDVVPIVRVDDSQLTIACNQYVQTYELQYGKQTRNLRVQI